MDDQSFADLVNELIAERECLGEVMTRVDVQQREGELRGAECLEGEGDHHDRVLATREHQRRAFELGRDLTHNVDRLGLERLEVRQAVV